MVNLKIDKVVVELQSDFNIRTGTYLYSAYLKIEMFNNILIIAKDLNLTVESVESILSLAKQPKLSILYLHHDDLINIPKFIHKHEPSKIEIVNFTELELN